MDIGWLVGGMDGWTEGWMDGRWISGRVDGRRGGWEGRWTDGWGTREWLDGEWMEERVRWMEKQGKRGQHTFLGTQTSLLSPTLHSRTSAPITGEQTEISSSSQEEEQRLTQICSWLHCQEASHLWSQVRGTEPRFWPSAGLVIRSGNTYREPRGHQVLH